MIRTERRMALCKGLLVVNLAFIWGNSLMPGEVSAAFSDWVGQLLSLLFDQSGPVQQGHGLLRKLAHFSEFACLGVLLGWLLSMLGKHRLQGLLLGAGAACIDEAIQLFVPGRGPGLLDVAIDSCGVAAGLLLLTLLGKIKTHGTCKPFQEDM